LEQNDVSLMMSHINSYSREKLGNKSPLELFRFICGYDALEKLGVKSIPAKRILLKPALLKK